MLSCQVNPFGSHFSSLQSKEAKVEPIHTPPTPSPASEDAELSGEPVPEGTKETSNLSADLHSSPEQGKSLELLNTQWVMLSDDWVMCLCIDDVCVEHLTCLSLQP